MNGDLKPFERMMYDMPPLHEFVPGYVTLLEQTGIRDTHDFPKDEADAQRLLNNLADREWHRHRNSELYGNGEYTVVIDRKPRHEFSGMTLWHLSIKRNDRQPVHDWRDMQAIKNMLCGEAVEAIEIYPNTKRLVDSANQYHLWAFVDQKPVNGKGGGPPILPVGFMGKFVADNDQFGAVQRKAPTEDAS